MKKLLLTLAILAVCGTAHAGPAENIKERCEREWGADYQMQKYCRDTQTQAYNALVDLKNEMGEDKTLLGILGRCGKEWGTDYQMWKYCTDTQIKAYEALQ